jgi:RES domain-containing protein
MPLVYRITKKRHAVYDGGGAALVGGRWTSPGRPVVYAAEHYATALLEKLVQAGRLQFPGKHHAAPILIPDDVPVERFDPAAIKGWEAEDSAVAREYGNAWFDAGRTAVLRVPSVPGQPVEWNVVIAPQHRDAARIRVLNLFDVVWDGRLFGPGTGKNPDYLTS